MIPDFILREREAFLEVLRSQFIGKTIADIDRPEPYSFPGMYVITFTDNTTMRLTTGEANGYYDEHCNHVMINDHAPDGSDGKEH